MVDAGSCGGLLDGRSRLLRVDRLSLIWGKTDRGPPAAHRSALPLLIDHGLASSPGRCRSALAGFLQVVVAGRGRRRWIAVTATAEDAIVRTALVGEEVGNGLGTTMAAWIWGPIDVVRSPDLDVGGCRPVVCLTAPSPPSLEIGFRELLATVKIWGRRRRGG
ncbi:hypothetical protein ACLOJK_006530 [Asimina triloba]